MTSSRREIFHLNVCLIVLLPRRKVEDIPSSLLQVLELLKGAGMLATSVPASTTVFQPPEGETEEMLFGEKRFERVSAVTVDFFREGSYSPALAATAPLFLRPAKGATDDQSGTGSPTAHSASASSSINIFEDNSLHSLGHNATPRISTKLAWDGGDGPDTEAEVCMVWLQVRMGIVKAMRWLVLVY